MNKYTIQNFSHLTNIGQISDTAMQMHFKLYEGYVNNINSIGEKLSTLEKNTPEWNELHRRYGWEWNGMRNHEIFFDLLKTEKNVQGMENSEEFKNIEVFKKIVESFGSFENWKADFVAICKMRGMGWAMLVEDSKTGQLINTWVNEHDAGMLSDVKIILLIDMFEHAYIKDFGTDRAPYINSIFEHLDFEKVNNNLI